MEGQPFRDDSLWCLEVDDLFKANEGPIKRLYGKYSQKVAGKPTLFLKDAIKMVKDAQLNMKEESAIVAYAYSKETIADEMEQYD